MKENDIQQDIASIRSLMERSSKFISLSGLSGVLAGIYALGGAAVAYFELSNQLSVEAGWHTVIVPEETVLKLCLVAAIVLILSICTGLLFSYRKAKQKGQAVWGRVSREVLFNMTVPLLAGGGLMLILLYRGYFGVIAPTSLIFYGLALVAASNFTYTEVRFLGLCDIILGLIAACLPEYGLLFWAFGFGVLHIVYGSVMYFKYDR